MEKRIEITFLRHGQSRADVEQVHEGRYDSPLTELGRKQAHDRAKYLEECGVEYECIFSSPLVRAVETAKIIGGVLSASCKINPNWAERDNGSLAGLSFQESEIQYPKPDFKNPFQPYVVSTEEGESEWTLQSRAAKAIEEVIRRDAGSYLVVSHGAILNAAMRVIVGAPPPVNDQSVFFRFGDTAYVETTYYPQEHRWVIQKLWPGDFSY